MLKVRDLAIVEHGNVVLGDISLEIKRGEIVALIGPNYSGKSTLLRALAGGFRHFEGDSRVSSYALAKDPKHYKSQLGYASPINQPEEYLTGLEWLEIIGAAYNVAPKKRIGAILDLAEKLEVKEELYRTIEHTSLAARQKISLIASLFHQPTVALWDEPTQFLDPLAQDALLNISRTFAGDGGAILLASNHLEWTEQLASRYLFIEDGQLVAEGTLTNLRNHFQASERTLVSVFHAAFDER